MDGDIIKLLITIGVIYSFFRKMRKKANAQKAADSSKKAEGQNAAGKPRLEASPEADTQDEGASFDWLDEASSAKNAAKSLEKTLPSPSTPKLSLEESGVEPLAKSSLLKAPLLNEKKGLDNEKAPVKKWKGYISNRKKMVILHEIFAPCKARQQH